MRELATGRSIRECQRNVNRMISRGWRQISDVKIDDSIFSEIRYVAVMEIEAKEGNNKSWNKNDWWR